MDFNPFPDPGTVRPRSIHVRYKRNGGPLEGTVVRATCQGHEDAILKAILESLGPGVTVEWASP
jgi:hypothetical protein